MDKLNEIRTEIDLLDSFPTQAEDPVVVEIKNNEPAIYVAVYGDTETSFQAKFLIPMAVSPSFGLVAATVLTLIFVPALYVVIREWTL